MRAKAWNLWSVRRPLVSGLVAGFVLGEDEGLAAGLRERFRASGLYHLLRVA